MSRWPAVTVASIVAICAMPAIPVQAHDWYPPYCCSGGDCAPIDSTRVQTVPEGFVIDGHFNVPRSEVRDSMDGRYHGCFPKPDKLQCFFAPPPGS